ncbi:hypothetical protein RHGRI_017097 [Rhododendron griersonianum]|uniref:Uncharacterized protein n=1 Tax=Rhododendron griersonianum TaxID=479676 RepID=A0AAV6JWL9_9ERIC|nr:hypothetical protein RHGRI_017097 [Rhododendron griersonianum]
MIGVGKRREQIVPSAAFIVSIAENLFGIIDKCRANLSPFYSCLRTEAGHTPHGSHRPSNLPAAPHPLLLTTFSPRQKSSFSTIPTTQNLFPPQPLLSSAIARRPETLPAATFIVSHAAEAQAFLEAWVQDGKVVLPKARKEPTRRDMEHPDYCIYLRMVRHPTKDCQCLRTLFEKFMVEEAVELTEMSSGTPSQITRIMENCHDGDYIPP